jgi:hypothetical protein
MPETLRLTESQLPVYMTIGADDPFRITRDRIQELQYTIQLLNAWRLSSALAGPTRARAITHLLEACAEHVAARREETSLGVIHPYAVQLAIYFISALPTGTRDPECGVDRDGDINLEWYGAKGHVLTLSINGGGRITYAYLHGDQHERGALAMKDRIPPRLLELIQHFA